MLKIADLIRKINTKLKDLKIDFVFSGAIAANVYRTIPRATMDLDIAIPFNERVLKEIKDKFNEFTFENWELLVERLEIKKKNPDVIIPEFLRLKHESGFEIDLFPLYTKYLKRKTKASIQDFEIEVIGPEDLISIKSIFNRYKDRDDIINILQNPHLKLDMDYLLQELEEYGNKEIIELVKKNHK